MQGSALKLSVVTLIIAALAISGCGSSGGGDGILDQIGYEYFISSIDVKDRDVSTTDIDILRDCNAANDTGLLTKASMDMTLESSTDTDLDAWLYKVRIKFDLIDYVGMPDEIPSIPTKTYETTALIRSKGGSVTSSFDLLSILDKENYVNLLGGDEIAAGVGATFQVTVTAYMTFTPDDPDNDYESDWSFTINVQNFFDGSCTDE